MQLLPYYIPPVVIANLINMVFFFFLLGAVEFFPMMTGLFQRTTRTNPIFTKPTSSVVETTELEVQASVPSSEKCHVCSMAWGKVDNYSRADESATF